MRGRTVAYVIAGLAVAGVLLVLLVRWWRSRIIARAFEAIAAGTATVAEVEAAWDAAYARGDLKTGDELGNRFAALQVARGLGAS